MDCKWHLSVHIDIFRQRSVRSLDNTLPSHANESHESREASGGGGGSTRRHPHLGPLGENGAGGSTVGKFGTYHKETSVVVVGLR